MSTSEAKSVLKLTDWIVGLSIVMMFGARIVTLIYFSNISEVNNIEVENLVKVYESSPLTKAILNLKQVGVLFTLLLYPALVFAIYFYYRRKVKLNKFDPEVVYLYSLVVFFMALIDFINNISLLVGRLI